MINRGKRAVACRGWQWMPGMRTLDAMRVIHDPDRWPDRPCAIREGSWVDTAPPRPLGDHLPDFTDPATLGCLLALVREAWGMSTGITVSYSSDEGLWGVSWCGATHGGWCGRGKTEAEALVAALEGAP
jgi:hypothetical protein